MLLFNKNGEVIKKEVSGPLRGSTNNRAEITSALEGLRALKVSCSVKLYSDSAYLVNSMREGWARKWKKQGWVRKNKSLGVEEKTPNADLWELLLEEAEKHQVSWMKVKGHAGVKWNEEADRLAGEEYRRVKLEDQRAEFAKKDRELEIIQHGWPDECVESYRRFGHDSALLYPLIPFGRETGEDSVKVGTSAVMTPKGRGTVVSAIGDTARILLDSTQPVKPPFGKSAKEYRPTIEVPIKELMPA